MTAANIPAGISPPIPTPAPGSLTGARPILQWETQGSNYITNVSQLSLLSSNLSGVYILGADITLTSVWTPVGSGESSAFIGTLLGNGYTISGLTVSDSTSACVGLFGYTKGATISGGSITNAYSGAYWTTATGDNSKVGGLVGENDGGIIYSYTVSPVSSSGTGTTAGALVGLNGTNGTISNTYWNTEIAGSLNGVGSGSTDQATGLTIADMMSSNTFSAWNSATWGMIDGISFPYLKWQYSGTPQFISGNDAERRYQ